MKDTSWLKKNDSIYKDIFNSLNNRDGNEDGILDRNTSRCGDGSEITTYDNIDISLSQAQNNLYMAVKTWAGYIFLGKIFSIIEETELSTLSEEKAYTCAASIISRYDNSKGFIPPFFNENHNTSRIIPAIEGLIYPYIIGDLDAVSPTGRFGSFITVLKKHVENILKPGVCIDSLSGGWKLSSSSKNTWMSKIILSQYVAQKILKIKSEEWDNWDAIHASWLQNGCSSFAATDQINSETGKDLGSRLYPRLVTSILWINF